MDLQEELTELDVIITEVQLDKINKMTLLDNLNNLKDTMSLKNTQLCG